jgi:hypothetical protein
MDLNKVLAVVALAVLAVVVVLTAFLLLVHAFRDIWRNP